jgi:hypothetical protein
MKATSQEVFDFGRSEQIGAEQIFYFGAWELHRKAGKSQWIHRSEIASERLVGRNQMAIELRWLRKKLLDAGKES